MADSIMFTKPADKIPLPIIITIDGDGVGVTSGAENKSIQDKVSWAGDVATITKTAINDKLHDLIRDQDRAARGGGGSAPPPPTRLQEKQAEVATKMKAAIKAANDNIAGSITEPQQAALLELIANAPTESELDAIAIPDASSTPDVIKTALDNLTPVRGGKRRRKTNKRARKGKRGTRRHL